MQVNNSKNIRSLKYVFYSFILPQTGCTIQMLVKEFGISNKAILSFGPWKRKTTNRCWSDYVTCIEDTAAFVNLTWRVEQWERGSWFIVGRGGTRPHTLSYITAYKLKGMRNKVFISLQ